jgi:ATP synthase F1 epsilon subunit
MATRTPYPCRVVTPDGVAFDGPVQQLLVTGVGGGAGFMDRHTPLVADLKLGTVKVHLEDDSWKEWATTEGFSSVHDSTGLVVVEEAIAFEDITSELAAEVIAEAEAEVARAEEQKDSEDEDVYKADLAKAAKTMAWGAHLQTIVAERA